MINSKISIYAKFVQCETNHYFYECRNLIIHHSFHICTGNMVINKMNKVPALMEHKLRWEQGGAIYEKKKGGQISDIDQLLRKERCQDKHL